MTQRAVMGAAIERDGTCDKGKTGAADSIDACA